MTSSITDRLTRMPERRRTYYAVSLAPDPPKYPDVETLLGRLDGIWSRTGAGEIACPVYRTQSAELSFTTFDGSALPNPPEFEPGRGTADFVVYEQKLSAEKLNEAACIRCYQVAKECSYREPLSACTDLNKCLQTTGVALGVCAERYR